MQLDDLLKEIMLLTVVAAFIYTIYEDFIQNGEN